MKPNITIDTLESICQAAQVSVTPKRRSILLCLLAADAPMSAYDIVRAYQARFQKSLPAMSVYRILDLFVKAGVVHKLESVNAYLLCDHLACDHTHDNAQFLICDTCHAVTEITMDSEIHQRLVTGVKKTGFQLNKLQVELHGTCQACVSA